MTRKIFSLDINWRQTSDEQPRMSATGPHHFVDIDARAFYDYHRQVDITEFWMPVTNWAGYAYYPSRLNAVAGGKGADLFPKVWQFCQEDQLPCWGYFCIGSDLMIASVEGDWVLPGNPLPWPMLAPESPWIDLAEQRIEEFLKTYPVEYIMLDWFTYGSGMAKHKDHPLTPHKWMEEPWKKLFGSSLPSSSENIHPEMALKYKRHIIGENAVRLSKKVKEICPHTEVVFNLPYDTPYDPLWTDHPLLEVSDMLFAECNRLDIIEWLLEVKRENQHLMCMVHGRPEEGACDLNSSVEMASRGCDLFASVLPEAPKVTHHPMYNQAFETIRSTYATL